jgi:hypothetical protein
MTNVFLGEADLVADGTTYRLLLDVNAWCDIEASTGMKLPAIVEEMGKEPSLSLLRTIICAGLQEHQPGTTIRGAGKIVSAAGDAATVSALRRAMGGALPEVEEDAARPPRGRKGKRKATAGTG